MECSSIVPKCADDSSEESTEGPIVDVNVGRPGRRRRGRGMNTRRNQSMKYYTRRGSGGSAGGSGGCPGSLEDCVAACPTKVARVYTVCVDNCGRVCSKK